MSTASRSLLVVRRNLLARSRAFHTTALRKGGGGGHGVTPPLAPFQRSPARYEPMTENTDTVWDDGVAPELALDFDSPNVSSREALYTSFGAFTFLFFVFQTVNLVTNGAKDANPALNHSTDCVIPDYAAPRDK